MQNYYKQILKEFIKYSNNVEFLIPEAYYESDAPALIKTVGLENFKFRKTKGEVGRLTIIKDCDHIVVLPGGTGTLEELLYCNETLRSEEHDNKLILVNIDGFFNGILSQIKSSMELGLIKPSAINFNIVDNVDQISFE